MQREAEEAARVYDEFVESFKVDDKPKAFVRGGLINPNAKLPATDTEGRIMHLVLIQVLQGGAHKSFNSSCGQMSHDGA